MNEQVATPEIAPVEEEEREVRRVLVLRQESVRPEFKYQVAMTVAEKKELFQAQLQTSKVSSRGSYSSDTCAMLTCCAPILTCISSGVRPAILRILASVVHARRKRRWAAESLRSQWAP